MLPLLAATAHVALHMPRQHMLLLLMQQPLTLLLPMPEAHHKREVFSEETPSYFYLYFRFVMPSYTGSWAKEMAGNSSVPKSTLTRANRRHPPPEDQR